MDKLTPEQRRRNMQAIKSKDTKIEIILRNELWKRGLRYRKNCKDLPGHPDIVFMRSKLAVFCDSEFWHGYDWSNRKDNIRTNKEFWIRKIEYNMRHDEEINQKLTGLGYTVVRFWGNEITKNPEICADKIEELLNRATARSSNLII
ncbi:MAG: very short patch repair endonuclease [Candidatus Methanoplasma sp.]|nr:very short patch repair endonuclease [Candidatus Methanoplasma sp.]